MQTAQIYAKVFTFFNKLHLQIITIAFEWAFSFSFMLLLLFFFNF